MRKDARKKKPPSQQDPNMPGTRSTPLQQMQSLPQQETADNTYQPWLEGFRLRSNPEWPASWPFYSSAEPPQRWGSEQETSDDAPKKLQSKLMPCTPCNTKLHDPVRQLSLKWTGDIWVRDGRGIGSQLSRGLEKTNRRQMIRETVQALLG